MASIRRRTLAVVPCACTSNRPPSIAPRFSSTSGGWMIGPAFVRAASSASTQGRTGKSGASFASTASVRCAGNTPVGRFAARTGALTSAGAVFRARYGSVPVSARANGRRPPARAMSRAIANEPKLPGVRSTIWRSVSSGPRRLARSSWAVAGSAATISSAPSRASPRSAVARSRRARPLRPSACRVMPVTHGAQIGLRAAPEPDAMPGEGEIGGGGEPAVAASEDGDVHRMAPARLSVSIRSAE